MLRLKCVMMTLAAGLSCMSPAQEQKTGNVSQNVVELEALSYPAIARAARISGRVVVLVKLDDTGKVISASAIPKIGLMNNLLTDDTLSNVRKWRFHPNPQKEALIVYDFQINKDCAEYEIKGRVPSTFHFQVPNLATVTACPIPIDTSTAAK